MTVGALVDALRDGGCVVLTGAGVSTESGIPDFRSPTGSWARFDPLEYGSIEAFRRDPERVWEFYGPRYRMLAGAEPNAAHDALAELERRGVVDAIVTQNIDCLHERAGSSDVVEVHGSIRTASCPACGREHGLDEVLELVDEGVPHCESCAAVLKPDVVFFGELLSAAAMDRATELATRARVLLVVGSTLEVYPVAALPLDTQRAGGCVAIVNRGPTAFDGRADIRLEGAAGELLTAVVGALDRG